ncbi:acyltransferase [Streptomyces sp. NPDC060194]|uniref:acyltransferase family protein n=1 Tax=Streptomyces sp. NPDC060194 TaxID=3347069 RepID=UPI00366A183B
MSDLTTPRFPPTGDGGAGPYGTPAPSSGPDLASYAAPYEPVAAPYGSAAPYAPAPAPFEPTPAAEPVAEQAEPARSGGRNLYFDFLRALALFRVVVFHATSWVWLPLLFPSMGVMFALAGNLMARSLSGRPSVTVIRGRMRRLLPPLWAVGGIAVTAMLVQGWQPAEGESAAAWWGRLLYWVVPLSDPPYLTDSHGLPHLVGDGWAEAMAGPLWYLRTYLQYVLLSPLFLWCLRKAPWATMGAPVALLAAMTYDYFSPAAFGPAGELLDVVLWDTTTFAACWILGMAHQMGIMDRLPRYVVPSVAPMIAGVGLWYAVEHDWTRVELDGLPLADAIWSFAVVLLLLHFTPDWSEWPARLRRWGGLISLLNARAVTVYLWHNVSILVALTLVDHLWGFDVLGEQAAWLLDSPVLLVLTAWLVIAVAVVAFGWVEDVAAKRRVRLWPAGGPGRPSGRRARPA